MTDQLDPAAERLIAARKALHDEVGDNYPVLAAVSDIEDALVAVLAPAPTAPAGLRDRIERLPTHVTVSGGVEWTWVERDAVLAAIASPSEEPGLDAPPEQIRDDDGKALEWSNLSRAMDAAEDVMMRRGHRTPSWANEEFAAAVRAAARLAKEPGS